MNLWTAVSDNGYTTAELLAGGLDSLILIVTGDQSNSIVLERGQLQGLYEAIGEEMGFSSNADKPVPAPKGSSQ